MTMKSPGFTAPHAPPSDAVCTKRYGWPMSPMTAVASLPATLSTNKIRPGLTMKVTSVFDATPPTTTLMGNAVPATGLPNGPTCTVIWSMSVRPREGPNERYTAGSTPLMKTFTVSPKPEPPKFLPKIDR